MSTPEDELREDLEALRRTKARYDAFFQEISRSLNDSAASLGGGSFEGSNSFVSSKEDYDDDDVTSGFSNETRTTGGSLNDTLDSGLYDHRGRRRRQPRRGSVGGGSTGGGGGNSVGRFVTPTTPSPQKPSPRVNRIMQSRTGSYDEEKFHEDSSFLSENLTSRSMADDDPLKRNSLEMKYKLPGFVPDATINVTTGSMPVNASEFYFDGQF